MNVTPKYFNTGIIGAYERILNDGVYVISPANCKGKCLGIYNKSLNYDEPIISDKITKESHQLFIFTFNAKTGFYIIKPLSSLFYLSVKKQPEGNYENALIVQGNNSQANITNFRIKYDNFYTIELADTGFYFTHNSNKTVTLGSKAYLQESKFEIYTTEVIKSGLYHISSFLPPKFFISLEKDNKTKGPFLTSKSKNFEQVFNLLFDKNDGCYSVINVYNDKSLTLSNTILQHKYHNLDSQKWVIGSYDMKGNNFFLVSKTFKLFFLNVFIDNMDKIDLTLIDFLEQTKKKKSFLSIQTIQQ